MRCPKSAKGSEQCSELDRNGQFPYLNSIAEQSDAPSFANGHEFIERLDHPAAELRRSGREKIFSKLWVWRGGPLGVVFDGFRQIGKTAVGDALQFRADCF